MTAREKAIEAAARAVWAMEFLLGDAPWEDYDEFERGQWLTEELKVNAAAPHIESALLDRIEEEIGKLVHEPNRDENGDQSYGYGLGLNAVLVVLSRIREEGERK